jgi:hypothetical protein
MAKADNVSKYRAIAVEIVASGHKKSRKGTITTQGETVSTGINGDLLT